MLKNYRRLLFCFCPGARPLRLTVKRYLAFPSASSSRRNSRIRGRVELAPTSAAVLRELEKFLIETGGRYLPPTTKLSIRVADIDLVGDFELFRGPQADQVRITKGLYPPHRA